MNHYTAQIATANFIKTLNTVDIEVITQDNQQVIISLPAGVDSVLLEGDDQGLGSFESAVVDASYHRDRGAAFAQDAGAA